MRLDPPQRRRRRWPFLVAGAGVLAGAVSGFWLGAPPSLELTSSRPAIGPATEVSAQFYGGRTGLGEVRLEISQAERTVVLAERRHTPRPAWKPWGGRVREDRLTADAGWRQVEGLEAGGAVLRAVASRPGTWLRRPPPISRELRLEVKRRPPELSVLSSGHYPVQGGADLVVYRLGPGAERDGVRVGDLWFAGYPAPPDTDGGERRLALYAVPFDHATAADIRLVAEDDAGNVAAVGFIDRLRQRPASADVIRLDDDFLQSVVPEILERSPLEARGDLLADYLAINGELRRRNAARLAELAAASAAEPLWSRPFLAMPGGQVMSPFADRRTYLYDGREVDRQVHLGYDLASVRRAPVPAANDGVVALARYFGIYGNAVVLDHGQGLMSLYGHLSTIAVEEGESVTRGQTIGRTGRTGLAGGDHLHFTVLVGGVAVDPKEWWDGRWVADRVAGRLGPDFAYRP